MDSQELSDRATSKTVLANWVRDARCRTLQLVSDLDDAQLIGPKLPIVNPLLWEIAHAAWFQDFWVLQQAAKRPPLYNQGHQLFDSISIDHDVRWDLPLPTRQQTLQYIQDVRDAVLDVIDTCELSNELTYFIKLSVFHEDMHTEAFTYTRQTLAYPAPKFSNPPASSRSPDVRAEERVTSQDIFVAGGTWQMGAERSQPFVFDNEKWSHAVHVPPFSVAETAVTQAQFAEFVDDGGYDRSEFWTPDGWEWRTQADSRHPVYWKKEGDWLRRHFDRWLPLEPNLPVIHVNWFEADAYCRWAGRRLPTEAEWEVAAAAASGGGKRHYPWGEAPPTPEHANLDWRAGGTVAVTSHSLGDSAGGCRQMLGNVWEWTATRFHPYPEFVPDPYQEYSRSSFGDCFVLRGGCWATRSRLLRNTWRNFYRPERRDVLAGFRTAGRRDED